jgi:hypothetical protein
MEPELEQHMTGASLGAVMCTGPKTKHSHPFGAAARIEFYGKAFNSPGKTAYVLVGEKPSRLDCILYAKADRQHFSEFPIFTFRPIIEDRDTIRVLNNPKQKYGTMCPCPAGICDHFLHFLDSCLANDVERIRILSYDVYPLGGIDCADHINWSAGVIPTMLAYVEHYCNATMPSSTKIYTDFVVGAKWHEGLAGKMDRGEYKYVRNIDYDIIATVDGNGLYTYGPHKDLNYLISPQMRSDAIARATAYTCGIDGDTHAVQCVLRPEWIPNPHRVSKFIDPVLRTPLPSDAIDVTYPDRAPKLLNTELVSFAEAQLMGSKRDQTALAGVVSLLNRALRGKDPKFTNKCWITNGAVTQRVISDTIAAATTDEAIDRDLNSSASVARTSIVCERQAFLFAQQSDKLLAIMSSATSLLICVLLLCGLVGLQVQHLVILPYIVLRILSFLSVGVFAVAMYFLNDMIALSCLWFKAKAWRRSLKLNNWTTVVVVLTVSLLLFAPAHALPAHHSKLPACDLHKDASYTVLKDDVCKAKFGCERVGVTVLGFNPSVSANCQCNEVISLSYRALRATPKCAQGIWNDIVDFGFNTLDAATQASSSTLASLFDATTPFTEWVSRKTISATRRVDLLAAWADRFTGLSKTDFYRQFFVKRELVSKTISFVFTDYAPRSIQGMSDKLQVTLGPYFHKLSKSLHFLGNTYSPLCYAIGKTAEEMGDWMHRAESHFAQSGVVLYCMNDASKLDAHLVPEAFKAMHKWYTTLAPKPVADAYFKKIDKRGFTRHNIVYSHTGTRASGDSDTSVDNSLLVAFWHIYALHLYGYKIGTDYWIAVAGDDVIIVTTTKMKDFVEAIESLAGTSGMVMKPSSSTEPCKVDFLSALFYPTNDPEHPIVMGPKPGRMLARLGWSTKHFKDTLKRYAHLRSVALGLKHAATFEPVLGALVDMIISVTDDVNPSDPDPKDIYKVRATMHHAISPRVYAFLAVRYDVTVGALQQLIEDLLLIKSLPVTLSSAVAVQMATVDLS